MDYRKENIMDRKTFLRKSVQVGLGSSGMFLFVKGGASAQTMDEHTKREQKFKEGWIKALMENLEKHFDQKTRIKPTLDSVNSGRQPRFPSPPPPDRSFDTGRNAP